MQVGFAKVTITPPLPVQLAGYGVERTGTGVADNLQARAMVCEEDGHRVALLACDLLWLERRHVKVLRERVAEIADVAPDSLMVAASHTHSGPDTMDWFHFAPVDPKWLHALLKQLASAVFLAAGNLREAKLERLVGQVEIGVNRRVHKEREGYRLGVNTEGPVDHTLSMLRVTADDGTLLGSVMHQQTHPVVLSGQSTVVSGDWPGEACRVVEQTLGGCCLFVNGACGDINPRVGPGRLYSEVLRVGRQCGGAAVELLNREPTDAVGGLGAVRESLEVAHRPHPYLDVPYERRLAEDGGMFLETQVLKLGALSFISCPGECLIETGRKVLSETKLATAEIAGYTNDYIGYLPLPHIYEQGGYEPSATMLPPESVIAWTEHAVQLADRLA